MKQTTVFTLLTACWLLAGVMHPSHAQAPRAASSTTTPPRISGNWALWYDSRVVPAANLVPTVTRDMIDAHLKRDAHNIRFCNLVGTPFVMDIGRAIDIREGRTQIIINPENLSAPRYLYTNRTTHIGEDRFDPSSNGDSIARWEQDTLVVDTVGFHEDHGITAIPGGGYRTPTAHLVERYRLIEGGNVLQVTFTWTDPNMFRTPHTYEYRYYRLPAHYEPLPPFPCDPYNETRAKFLDGRPVAVPQPMGIR